MKIIGVDPGVHTGFALWDAADQKLLRVESGMIHVVMRETFRVAKENPFACVVLFEDARRRTWFGNADKRGPAAREGVGSIKRDSTIWEDFLTDAGIPFEARCPVIGGTKWTSAHFQALTKWPTPTNEHARDAAMQVFGLSLLWATRAFTDCIARQVKPRASSSSRS